MMKKKGDRRDGKKDEENILHWVIMQSFYKLILINSNLFLT